MTVFYLVYNKSDTAKSDMAPIVKTSKLARSFHRLFFYKINVMPTDVVYFALTALSLRVDYQPSCTQQMFLSVASGMLTSLFQILVHTLQLNPNNLYPQ